MNGIDTLPETLDLDLDGLSYAAAPFLARLPVSDQRIQAAPDVRTLRFYQSTGLLDRPLRYDGRVARYGRRHLLQMLAVRALQSKGLSLAQVQTQLAGATNAELERQVTDMLGQSTVNAKKSPPGVFDLAVPVFKPRNSAQPTPPAAPDSHPTQAHTPVSPVPLSAAELAPGLVLTIDSRIHPNPARIIELLRRALHGEET